MQSSRFYGNLVVSMEEGRGNLTVGFGDHPKPPGLVFLPEVDLPQNCLVGLKSLTIPLEG